MSEFEFAVGTAIPGSPALQVIRYFMDARRQIVEIAMNTHPADHYTYCIEIVQARNGMS
jgi:DNA-binding GntR family transcriptional regulator